MPSDNISGVTQSPVNNIIRTRHNSATVSTIKKLCDGLGITIDEFFRSDLFTVLKQGTKQQRTQQFSNCCVLCCLPYFCLLMAPSINYLQCLASFGSS